MGVMHTVLLAVMIRYSFRGSANLYLPIGIPRVGCWFRVLLEPGGLPAMKPTQVALMALGCV